MARPRKKRSRKSVAPPVQAPANVGFERVLERMREQGRSYDEKLLRSVYEFSAEMHRHQKRRSGEPFLTHPLSVAYILAGFRSDDVSVAVGLLHDVLEDTLTSREVLAEEFGDEIAELVDGVTKIGRHEYVRRDEAQAETFRKLILATVRDLRVILVKLADRLHNMMTLEHMPVEARRRISRETLEIYAPIAHRLGMAKVQGDLEDLAFCYLYPHQYSALQSKIAEKMKLGKDEIRGLGEKLEERLKTAEVEAEISSRVKRPYSVYSKLRRQGIDIAQLYDYLAFRVITRSLRDCYAALGVVHQGWRPVPGRFKDYIAMPKPNLYQSLHTTVVGPSGQPFEVQIRTVEMDLVAEEGIAAHWRYKQRPEKGPEADPGFVWLRQLLDWQKEVQDPRSFLATLKVDLYPDEVYAFSPKGAVFSFPRGATPLDFAYKIHTELGHQCVGARVNGKLVPLRTPLHNGDIVEVLTAPGRHPSRDWLQFVKTSRAKSKIRQWLNTRQKKRAMEIGRRLLERELKKHKASPKKVFAGKPFEEFMVSEGIPGADDLFSRVGFGKLQAKHVVSRVLTADELSKEREKPGALRAAVDRIFDFGGGAITVRGHGDLLAYLAKCCTPRPGEEIVGFVTRGRGVSVHSAECSNVKNLLYNPEREIEVEWARPGKEVYPVVLEIQTEDQPGMLAKLTEVMAKLDSNIRQIEAETVETGRGLIEVVMEVRNRKHLEKLRRGIQALPGVLEVDRRLGPTR